MRRMLRLCLGFKPEADVEGGKTDAAGYEGIFKQMKEEFGFKYVVSTLRESLQRYFQRMEGSYL